jgi:predicted CXXCH cytochrome family protein
MACLLLAVVAMPAAAQITGSAHDFTDNLDRNDATFAETWNTSGELCAVCHTPHNGNLTVSGAPLWDRGLTVTSFTLYTSTTLNATMAQPTGQSLLCLGCHDGTVALDNFGSAPTTTTLISAYPDGAQVNVGTTLADDHPVSFAYADAITGGDTELNAAGDAGVAALLFGGNVECASCHDVHNNGAGPNYLLRVDNAGSALCFTCHNK